MHQSIFLHQRHAHQLPLTGPLKTLINYLSILQMSFNVGPISVSVLLSEVSLLHMFIILCILFLPVQ